MGAPSSHRHEAVVIGAGQAGLAAAYYLAERGIDFTILEANRRVGDVWRERYDSLLLYSPAKYNALPGLPFPMAPSAFPTGRQMADFRRMPTTTGCRSIPASESIGCELRMPPTTWAATRSRPATAAGRRTR